ncbi:DNA double-strand break repair nuclease NurA [Acidianus sp.]|uniref:DNA double-strand break repair nuclease NurA n=1 Tax=Acidianus sp. TaxID=1872104 RepID=UPI00397D1F12
MQSQQNIMEILNSIVVNYVSKYLTITSLDDYVELNSTTSPSVLENEDIFFEVHPSSFTQEIYAVDGSSRSFVSGKGIISVSAVAISSSSIPIYGVYPSLDGEKELELKEPFIAVASSVSENSKIDPYLYFGPYVSPISITGDPFYSTEGFEVIESEIRSVLETKALNVVKGKGKIIVDGPLFPSYLYLTSKFKEKILEERKKIIDSNFIGIVKRLDKSRGLIDSIDDRTRSIIYQKFRIDPKIFLSDESFILHLVRFNYSPPYKILALGPFSKRICNNITVYMYYLIIPFHPYVSKFSILRIETLTKDPKILGIIASMGITKDGIPPLLALADFKAKKTSLALYRYIVSIVERLGIQASFYSRLSGELA